jgi:hypothetical protein
LEEEDWSSHYVLDRNIVSHPDVLTAFVGKSKLDGQPVLTDLFEA